MIMYIYIKKINKKWGIPLPASNIAFICIALNLALNILAFTPIIYINYGFVLIPFFSFCGALLGIGAIVLREPLLKSILAIVLNVAYLKFFFEFFRY